MEPERFPKSVPEVMDLYRDVEAYQANTRAWQEYQGHKETCSLVLHTATSISKRHAVEGQDLVHRLFQCCTPEIYAQLPPLAIVAKEYGIRFPIDPAIDTLPLGVALQLFSDTPETPIGWSWSASEPYTLTLRVNLRVPKDNLRQEIEDLISVMNRPEAVLGKGRFSNDPKHEQTMFLVWDLRRQGMTAMAIAEQLWPDRVARERKQGIPGPIPPMSSKYMLLRRPLRS